MSLKTKLISSISAFVLVLALLVVGVFALPQANVPLRGTINFQATSVYAEITGTISGQENGPKTLPKLEFSNGQTPDTSGWANGDLVFDPNASPIQIQIAINVKNLSERSLFVKVDDLVGAVTNLTKSVMVGAEDQEGAYVKVLPGQSVDYVISLSPTDEGEPVTGEYNYLITLVDETEATGIQIQAKTNQASLDSVSGGGTFDLGDTVTLVATSSDSNTFLAWATSLDPNEMEIVSTSETYSFELSPDSPRTYYALFNQTTSSQTVGDLIYTFYNEAKLAEITGRDSSFQGGDFTIPSVVPGGENSYKVYSIGSQAFYACSSLTSITIPEGVTSIGASAFQYCRDLTSIRLPSTLTSVGDLTFSGCSSLASVTIPEEVTSIGLQTFYNCSNLTEITIPEGVTSIGKSAFSRCRGLTQITINGNISTLGSEAFYGCTSLTKLTLGAGVTSIPSNLFSAYMLTNLNEIVVEEGSSLSAALPSGETWVKDGEEVTMLDGAGVYAKQA